MAVPCWSSCITGMSHGGNLAIKFALQWPDMVEKLVLNGANVEMFFGVKPHVQLTTFAGYGAASLFSRISRKAARRRDVLGLMVHPYGVRMDDLARLEMPTLIIVGEHDMIKDRQRWRRIFRTAASRCSATATILSPRSSRLALTARLWNSF